MYKASHLDLVLAVQFVIVQCVLRHTRAVLVHELDESDVLLGGNETHFVQIWVSVYGCKNRSSTEGN
jgi:hypothetical protein